VVEFSAREANNKIFSKMWSNDFCLGFSICLKLIVSDKDGMGENSG